MGGVAAQGLRHVLETYSIVQVEAEPMLMVEFKGLVFGTQGRGQVDPWGPEVIGEAQGATKGVQSVVRKFGGAVGEVGEAE